MARYIDAENMYKEVWKRSTSPLNEWDTWGVLNVLDMVKTEDVAPVVHAHWLEEEDCSVVTDSPWSMCSACGEYSPKLLYCAFCGAKMDEEVE